MRNRLARSLGPATGLRVQLLRASFASVGIKAYYVLAQFAVGVALARMLGPVALGTYAFTMAAVQILVIAAQFGFPVYLLRSIAVCRSQDDMASLKGLAISAMQIVLATSILIMVLGMAWTYGPWATPKNIPPNVMISGLLLVAPLALLATNGGVIQGLGHVVAGQLPDLVVRPTALLAGLLGLAAVGSRLSAQTALLANVATTVLALAVGLRLLARHMPVAARNSVATYDRRLRLQQSLPFLLLAGAQVINYQTDMVMLGLMVTPEEVGLYRVALMVTEGLGIALFAISVVIAPQIAKLHAQQDWPRIQRILVYSHRAGALVMLPAAILVILVGGPVLGLVFGVEFEAASGALTVLALSKVAYATVGFSGLALSMLGRAGAASVITLATVVLNVMLNLVLIPHYGIEGTALATGISEFVVAAIGIVFVKNAHGLDFSAIGHKRAENER